MPAFHTTYDVAVPNTPQSILILGGTAEASALARRSVSEPSLSVVLSLAGVTRAPPAQVVPVRSGGFGGVDGFRRYLRDHAVACVIDATHPFAAQISANAAVACHAEGVRRTRLTRPPWTQGPGDRWTAAGDWAAAVAALGPSRRRVFLPIGRQSLRVFAAAPHHFYLVRSIDPPDDLSFLPDHQAITGRPPFSPESEEALLRRFGIDVVVAKNSGGTGGASKLMAARTLGLPVIMVDQPPLPEGPTFYDVERALAFAAGRC